MTTPNVDPLDDDAVEEMLWRLERLDDEHHEQYRRLLNVEGHMERLARRINPETFAAWLRDYDCKAKGDKSVPHLRRLITYDLPRYITWLQRLHDAYGQVPPRSIFDDMLEGEDLSSLPAAD